MKKITTQRTRTSKAKQRAHLTFRMNVLFLTIFILFTMLIFRLGYLQIVKGEEYTSLLARTEEVPVNTSVPRGRIFDTEGRILVDNKAERAITYTKMQTTKAEEMWTIAEQLALLIEKDDKSITKSDLQDYWLRKNSENIYVNVSEEERKAIQDNDELTNSEKTSQINRLIREAIPQEDLDSFSKEDREIIAIYREMASGYALSPQIIKGEDVTAEEFARVSERLGELKGVNTTTDWRRVRNSNLAILGTTTLPKEGIPRSSLNHYLARDYSRNDRVGRSYVEQQYEEILQGQKSVVKNITDGKGRVIDTQTVYEGDPGKDIVLSIDTEVQARLEEVVTNRLLEMKRDVGTQHLDRMFFTLMDPNTGEIIAMVGKILRRDAETQEFARDPETGSYIVDDYAFGTFTTAYEAGSTVKAGTLLTGYRENAINVGDSKVDEPIFIAQDRPKSSVFNRSGRIPMNDLTALERSSNVYMFKTAFTLAGETYQPRESVNFNFDAFDKLRNGYAQLGLGVPTGIDLPGEVAGYSDPTQDSAGKLLDLSIGQYDTYTPLQLTQFISTIANGGKRLKPHVVKEIREPSESGERLGALSMEVKPQVLNVLENTQREINHVREGMRRVYQGSQGTARGAFNGFKYNGAGKTGTAETFAYDPVRKRMFETVTLTHVGFAPFDNPSIAYSTLIPWASTRDDYTTNSSTPLTRELVDAYFEILEKRRAEQIEEDLHPTIKPSLNQLQVDEEDEQ
ncbi:peptidoglycan D,D-transpeptidase FtsI family protein [Chryseomicrobium palamuruense]|uniref:Peptidoglycan D,D-transpeptidase FtsI family protein n=1 Tax=Chryseomicrobium palamuruense TaxID=682973 RepID=A0ABV8UXR7_9BACL